MKNNYLIEGETTKITIHSKGGVYTALIDTDDLSLVKGIGTSWGISWSGNGYKAVKTDKQIKGKKKVITLANLLLSPGVGLIVDHKNRNPLDNRRENLREIPSWGNNQNLSLLSNNKSGFRGVSWHKPLNKWRAKAVLNKKHYHLGYFDDIEEADRVVSLFRKQHMIYSDDSLQIR